MMITGFRDKKAFSSCRISRRAEGCAASRRSLARDGIAIPTFKWRDADIYPCTAA